MAEALKDKVGPRQVELLADAYAAAYPQFDAPAFKDAAGRGLRQLELKARIAQIAAALAAALPDSFERAAVITERAIADPELKTWELWPVTVWVGDAGTGDVPRAAEVLALITPRMSAEFGVRPLIDADPEAMRGFLTEWVAAEDEHLRRLASEGPRPLLPWAPRLAVNRDNPGWGLDLLDPLIDDPSEYVRRSVANHLNDIGKLDRDLAIATANRWQEAGGERTPRLLKHGLRTLLKAGDADALGIAGFDPAAKIEVERLALARNALAAEETLGFDVALRSAAREPQAAAIGYAIEFARPSGRRSRKVFKLADVSLDPGELVEYRRRYTFRPLSTRSYHAGTHALEIVINGRAAARAEFELTAPAS